MYSNMKKTILLFFLSFSILIKAQEEYDSFDKYGPPGVVYTNLKDALADVNIAYKVKIDNQLFEPKNIMSNEARAARIKIG